MDFDLSPELPSSRPPSASSPRRRSRPGPARSTSPSEYPQDLFELFRDTGLARARASRRSTAARAPGSSASRSRSKRSPSTRTPPRSCCCSRRLPTGPVLIAGQRGAEAAVRARRSRRASSAPAFGLSEPQAGSDVVGMRTKAVRDGDDWVLNGTKCWMSGVVQADWYCVFAKTGPADSRTHDDISCFIVERALAGRLGRPHRRQDGRARRRHRRADPRRRARARRERRRRDRRLPARDARPQLDAPDRRRARHRARRGRADVRGRVREAARRVRARRSPTCRASSGRSPSSPPRSRPRACSRTAPRGWPTRASTPRSTCPTCRWRSTTRPRSR